MTDERLRELERRWKETGSVEDEAAYLLEQVRVGHLDQEKLELAAYCGYEPARLALRDDTATGIADLEAWLGGFKRRGRWCLVFALHGLAASALRATIGSLTPEDAKLGSDALASVTQWLEHPDAQRADAARRAAVAIAASPPMHPSDPIVARGRTALLLIRDAAASVSAAREGRPLQQAVRRVELLVTPEQVRGDLRLAARRLLHAN